jgi:hypothetical protein
MEKQGFIVLQIFRRINMFHRLARCLKAWGTGIIIMAIPVLFFYGDFTFGSKIWNMLICLYFVLFPVLLFFDNIFHRYRLFSKGLQFVVLAVLFILSEIEFFYLPSKFSQVQYLGSWITNATLLLFAVLAAFVVSKFLFPKRKLIIVQKEI